MKYLVFLLCMLSVICSTYSGSLAADKVVVIPLMGHAKPLKNIVTVAKKNGDFTDPVAAVNSIADAAADNPYLVVIGPGVYTLSQTLVMKSYVDISGSGKNVTRLTGAISNNTANESSAIIKVHSISILSNLTVENSGNENAAIGIYMYYAPSTCEIRNVKIHVFGTAKYNFGAYVQDSSAMFDTVDINVSGASDSNKGIASHTKADSGWVMYSTPKLVNSRVTASGASSYGLTSTQLNWGGEAHDEPILRRSTLQGETAAISSDHFFTISQSTLIGGIRGDNHNVVKCVACDDGLGHALDNNCAAP